MLIRVAVCGLMAAARLLELRQSRRNLRLIGATRARTLNQVIFPLIVALHGVLLSVTLLRGRSRARYGVLAMLLAVQPLRYWVLSTLGARWNVVGAVPAQMTLVTTGPYAFIRHPNYSVVAVEVAALPAAFGLDALAFGATLVNAALMAVRVHEEETLLFELPGYAEHFGRKRRFIPFVF